MKDKQINWYTIATRKPQQYGMMHQAIINAVDKIFRDYPHMYSYKRQEEDLIQKYQFVQPKLSEVKCMINPKDKRIEFWIPLECTDDEPLEM